jgi:hypothetical protein
VITGKEVGVFTQTDFARGIAIGLAAPAEVLEVASVE